MPTQSDKCTGRRCDEQIARVTALQPMGDDWFMSTVMDADRPVATDTATRAGQQRREARR